MKTILHHSILICLGLCILSSARATHRENLSTRIDSLVSLQHNEGEPGGVIVVLQGEKILHKQTYGLMNMEQGKAISTYTQFDIASVAKQFTGYAILLLEKEGLLDLDADIRLYLPYLPKYPNTITVRHLLQHTSGIASSDWLRLISGIPLDQEWNHHDEIALIAQYPQLNFDPNSTYTYSNAGYSLLASIVESVSGSSFADYLHQKVFRPLHMTSSFVLLPDTEITPDIALGYRKTPNGFEHFSSVTDFSYGSGNLLTTTADMILWGKHLMDPAPAQKELVERMFHRYNTLTSGDSLHYTYGLQVRNHLGLKMVEHSGGVPGFRNQFMVFPEHQTLIILMFNNESINTRSIALAITQMVLGENMKPQDPPQAPVEISLPLESIQRFQGTFRMEDGMEMTFTVAEDLFWLELPGNQRFQLFAQSETRFFVKEFAAACSFVINASGDADQMIWHQSGRDFPAIRTQETEPLSIDQLTLYTGNYRQIYLCTDYPVQILEKELIILLPETFNTYLGFGKLKLNHIRNDSFASDYLGMIHFTRDDSGQVDGFVIADAGRMKNITFNRTD